MRFFYIAIDYDQATVQIISSVDQGDQDTDFESGLSVGWIIFIVVICLIVAVAIGAGLGVCFKRRKRRAPDFEDASAPQPVVVVAVPVSTDESRWESFEVERA